MALSLPKCHVNLLSRTAVTKFHRPSDFTKQNLIPHSSRDWRFEIKMLGRHLDMRDMRENLFHASFLAIGDFLTVLGILCLVETSPRISVLPVCTAI
jgi:hypothetical protein